mmetsp:Transcript_40415/g.35874  ORF Transcript_40415/g.35874 Transcript_40415/m.35874 type:complete len:106 (-) Transcript_40415:58-375(-)
MSEEAFIRELGDEALTEEEYELKDGLKSDHIKTIKKMKMGKSGQECTVCTHKFGEGEKIWKLPCKHIFHEKCIGPWLGKNHTCPNCRMNLEEHFAKHPDGGYDKK